MHVRVRFGRGREADQAVLHVVEDVVVRLRIRRDRQRREQHVQRVRGVLNCRNYRTVINFRSSTDLHYRNHTVFPENLSRTDV